jgi:hypothetical protein
VEGVHLSLEGEEQLAEHGEGNGGVGVREKADQGNRDELDL